MEEGEPRSRFRLILVIRLLMSLLRRAAPRYSRSELADQDVSRTPRHLRSPRVHRRRRSRGSVEVVVDRVAEVGRIRLAITGEPECIAVVVAVENALIKNTASLCVLSALDLVRDQTQEPSLAAPSVESPLSFSP